MKTVCAVMVLFLSFVSLVQADVNSNQSFVVVELFGSEGCSSCPPADRLLSQVIASAQQDQKPIYALSFHVDYWNNLGWWDPFSKKEFTERQYAYSKVLQGQGVYTPQVIINGKQGFVGSDQTKLQHAITRELSVPATVSLQGKIAWHENHMAIQYEVRDYSADDVINIALVEADLDSNVIAGENSGQVLHHDHVVREFKVIPLTQASGEADISIDKVAVIKNANVILYVQDSKTMLIKAAQQLSVE